MSEINLKLQAMLAKIVNGERIGEPVFTVEQQILKDTANGVKTTVVPNTTTQEWEVAVNAKVYELAQTPTSSPEKEYLAVMMGAKSGKVVYDELGFSNPVFYNNTTVTEVSMPNVSNVPDNAFYKCTNLSKAIFPNVTEVGANAFVNCSSLTDVSIERLVRANSAAFNNVGIRTINVPALEYVGVQAFNGCAKLRDIELPNVTSINSSAFMNCTSLSTCSVGQGCSRLPAQAFYGCDALRDLELHSSTMVTIQANTFTGCSGVIVHVPTGLRDKYLANSAWSNLVASSDFTIVDDL